MKNNIIRIFMICLLSSTFSLLASGQTSVIRGKIVDKITKEALPGATIIEINENDRYIGGTTTGLNGEFILKVYSKNSNLGISFIGYKNQKIPIGDKTNFVIELEEATQQIEDISVTAKKIEKSDNGFLPITKRELTSSVASLDMVEVADVQATTISEAIQGRLSGIDISMASGDPGAGVSIQIRGASTINGRSEPLIVLNGIPYDTDISDEFDFASATEEDYGSLVDIAPEDILSIDILKDAAATAVWGSKAANGVLLITTKRGAKGKTIFNYSYKLKRYESPDPIPMLNGPEYVLTQQDARYNAEMDKTNAPPDFSDPYAFWPLQYDPDYQYYLEHSQSTDWIGAVTQTGFTHDHNFSLSGGGDKASYRLSSGYLDQTGTTIGTAYKRLTTRVNLDYRLTKKLLLYSDFSFSQGERDANNGNIRSLAYKKAPNMAIYNMLNANTPSEAYFSAYYNSGANIENYQGSGNSWWNPVALGYEGVNNTKSIRIIANLGFKYDINDDMYIDSYVSYDLANNAVNTFFPQIASGEDMIHRGYNKVKFSDSEAYNVQHRTKLVYQKTLNEIHKLTGVVSYDVQSKRSFAFSGNSEMTPSYWIKEFSQPGPLTSLNSGVGIARSMSYIGNVHYSLKDRYLINGGVRFDGSTSFGKGRKWGTFPFMSAAYRISSEPFMQGATFLNDLKIRTSFGLNGNAPRSSNTYFSRYGVSSSYIDMQGISPKNIELDNLRWEKIFQQNYAIDFSGFDNKLGATLEIYRKKTTDMLWGNFSIPSSTGFSNYAYINFGDMQNSGVEFSVNANVIQKKKVSLRLNFNIAKNRNEILSMPENVSLEQINMSQNGNYARRVVFGDPIGSFYGYVFDGVYSTDEDAVAKDRSGNVITDPSGTPLNYRFDTPNGYQFKGGDAIYRDINFDGLINDLDIVKLGDASPDFHGGFGSNLKLFNRFTINTFFHYKVGHEIVNQAKMQLENMYDRSNQAVSVVQRWRQPGDITNMPRALYQYGYNWLGSSRYVEDGTFLRFKTLSLTYDVKKEFAQKLKLSSLKFYFNVQNLYTWTDYTGQDPEVSVVTSNPFFVGYDNARTPPARNITFGIDVKF